MKHYTPHLAIVLALCTGLTGCGSSSGGSDDPIEPPDPDPPATADLSIADGEVVEGDTGQTAMEFVLTLSAALPDASAVDAATVETTIGAPATSGVDFEASSVTVNFAAGITTQTLTVQVIGDVDVEADETFAIQLSNASTALTPTNDTAVGTIRNDDATVIQPQAGNPLNDTGITACADSLTPTGSCGGSASAYPGQDGEAGRDLSVSDDSDGLAGFSFTKLDSNGAALGDQAQSYNIAAWDCVQDNVTGLVWETKMPVGTISPSAPRRGNALYSWYEPDQGAFSGTPDAGLCGGSACDTASYRDAVNSLNLCGFNDWRVPTRRELLSIVNFALTIQPVFEARFFPNTSRSFSYWTTSAGRTPSYRFTVSAQTGRSEAISNKTGALSLRLVRGVTQ